MSNDPSILDIILAKFDKLDERMDKLDKNQSDSNIILAKQEVNIDIHVKRTDLLEARLEPVVKHVQIVHAILKAIGGLAVLLTIITAILKIVEVAH